MAAPRRGGRSWTRSSAPASRGSTGAPQKDAKTRLQEILQARGLTLPEYTVESDAGKAHARRYVVRCRVPELDVAATGAGASRREAEQAAAHRVLERLA